MSCNTMGTRGTGKSGGKDAEEEMKSFTTFIKNKFSVKGNNFKFNRCPRRVTRSAIVSSQAVGAPLLLLGPLNGNRRQRESWGSSGRAAQPGSSTARPFRHRIIN